ncbi:histidine kinase [[Leptolyngbya] sp. PCC 7376]|uniref:ATP-binding protein n=1 Tax=[Leptolyngbya] sp. PCC 7376 TaxID=111781 RepID=UPI00029F4B6E|nr:ATP-binding protein [[Leptolyngbya] sp. PCC 7376]AFY39293.1 histidine kinase [[Leptolyngbya] sp. PCC 7376]
MPEDGKTKLNLKQQLSAKATRAIAAMVVSVGVVSTIALVTTDRQLTLKQEEKIATETLYRIKANLRQALLKRVNLTIALSAFWESHDETINLENPAEEQLFREQFDDFGAALDEQVNGILSLQLAPDGIVTYITNLERNKQAINHDLFGDPSRRGQVLDVISQRGVIIAGPIELVQGGQGLIARKAIFTKLGAFSPQRYVEDKQISRQEKWLQSIPSDFWGFATTVIDVETLFEEAGLNDLPTQYRYALRGRHGMGNEGEIFWGDADIFDDLSVSAVVSLPNGEWILGIQTSTSPWLWVRSTLIFVTGIGASLMLGRGILQGYEREKAIAQSRTKDEFLATISHEIRTPLNGIIGVNSLLIETPLNEQQRQFAQTIKTSGKHLLEIVNDILDFSKIEAEHLELEIKPFELHKLISQLSKPIESQAMVNELKYQTAIAPEIAPIIEGDVKRIHQILINLLTNSIKFTHAGEIRFAASLVKAPRNKQVLQFEVADTGIGIKPQDRKTLFSPFIQADSSVTRKYGGTGLGLSIAKRLCELMGGRIWFDSELGQGTTFYVQIPYIVGDAEASTVSELRKTDVAVLPQQQLSAPKQPTKTTSILVVEDVKLNQIIICSMLTKLGFEADLAENGLEAIAALNKRAYDVVLMDWHMPKMDGITATKKIRELQDIVPQPWIIAVTASASPEDRQTCLDAGMDDYLSKPLTLEQLTPVIERSPLEIDADLQTFLQEPSKKSHDDNY